MGFVSPLQTGALSFTFSTFVCEAGRLPGFCGLVNFSLFGGSSRVALEISTLVAASFDQGPIFVVFEGAREPGTA